MPEIAPFRGLRYAGDDALLAHRMAPPYDVITRAQREALLARHPHNAVRIELAESEDDAGYAAAGETLRRWRAEGVLVDDREPALYLLEESFVAAGAARVRTGLLARFRAEDYARGAVLPHEQTRKAAREDRIRMLRATRVNLSPIFMFFADTGERFAAAAALTKTEAPLVSCVDDAGTTFRLWSVTDPRRVAAYGQVLAGRAFIADGHHRYETALRYRDETGPQGAWTFGYFTPADSDGLVVLPYHRILADGPSLEAARAKLQDRFLVTEVANTSDAARGAGASTMPYAFGLAEPGKGALVAEALPKAEDLFAPGTPRPLRALDTYFLHQCVLPRILGVSEEAVRFVHSLAEAEAAVQHATCRLAVLMRRTPIRQIVDVAEASLSMPAKSTFFHPKIPAGLVIHPLLA